MIDNTVDFLESDDDYFNFRRNSLNSNFQNDDDYSDQESEKMISYFSDKISTLENSFYQMKKKSVKKEEFLTRDIEYLIEMIRTLFNNINDINENCLKIFTRNINKTEKIKKSNALYKELFEKYSQTKMNYRSVTKQLEYKEKHISDLEILIQSSDLEIFHLKTKISELKSKSTLPEERRYLIQEFEKKERIDQETITHLEKEKEDLNLIIDNLRNNLNRKENTIVELKRKIEMKSHHINELKEELNNCRKELERCKINLESEKKYHIAKADELKYITESFLRKRDYHSEERSAGNSSQEERRKKHKKNYLSLQNSERLLNNIIFDEKEEKEINKINDISCRKKISFFNNKY
jgi:hypothetical protein